MGADKMCDGNTARGEDEPIFPQAVPFWMRVMVEAENSALAQEPEGEAAQGPESSPDGTSESDETFAVLLRAIEGTEIAKRLGVAPPAAESRPQTGAPAETAEAVAPTPDFSALAVSPPADAQAEAEPEAAKTTFPPSPEENAEGEGARADLPGTVESEAIAASLDLAAPTETGSAQEPVFAEAPEAAAALEVQAAGPESPGRAAGGGEPFTAPIDSVAGTEAAARQEIGASADEGAAEEEVMAGSVETPLVNADPEETVESREATESAPPKRVPLRTVAPSRRGGVVDGRRAPRSRPIAPRPRRLGVSDKAVGRKRTAVTGADGAPASPPAEPEPLKTASSLNLFETLPAATPPTAPAIERVPAEPERPKTAAPINLFAKLAAEAPQSTPAFERVPAELERPKTAAPLNLFETLAAEAPPQPPAIQPVPAKPDPPKTAAPINFFELLAAETPPPAPAFKRVPVEPEGLKTAASFTLFEAPNVPAPPPTVEAVPETAQAATSFGPPTPAKEEPSKGPVLARLALNRVALRQPAEYLDRAETHLETWFLKWFDPPDPRRSSPRVDNPPLAAYHWAMDVQQGLKVANISASGMYLLTDERWTDGVIVSLTLQRTDMAKGSAESWIAVDFVVTRWCEDGIAGAFIPSRPGLSDAVVGRAKNCADKKELQRFVTRLATPARQ
jgi:hypothetical protein